MAKKYYRKLVRDGIPGIIKSKNQLFKTKILTEEEFDKALRKKFIEEAMEINGADKTGIIDELADMLELVHAASEYYGITLDKLEKVRIEKKEKRGGFEKKMFLVWAEEK